MSAKKYRLKCCFLFLLTSFRSTFAQADQGSSLSMQGFTGLLNTPDAYTQRLGTLDTLYTNQREPFNGRVRRWEDTYLFSFGMFPFAEVGGRLTNAAESQFASGARDLSLNVKLSTAPLTSRYRFSPALAFGIQDAGAGHHFFQTTYVAGSVNPVSFLRLSAGYGRGPDRMKGAFGGASLQATSWLSLLGDYDTNVATAGLRLTSPELPFIHTRLTGTWAHSLRNGQGTSLSGGFLMPLNMKRGARETRRQQASNADAQRHTLWGALTRNRDSSAAPAASRTPYLVPVPASSLPSLPVVTLERNGPESLTLATLRDQLVHDGFVNVRVGLHDTTLVVEYENIRYNHSELDALGVVLGLASRMNQPSPENLLVIVRRKGLALLQVQGSRSAVQTWLDGIGEAPGLSISQSIAPLNGTSFLAGRGNPRWFKASLMVYPSVNTLVGTEHGLFDYQLSIRPELQLPLWRGATAAARADLPVAWSHNLQDGQVYASSRTPARLDRLMLFQAVRIAPGLVANLGAGKILTTTNGTLNELNWSIRGGMNRLKVTQLWGRDGGTTRNLLLGSYRVLLSRYDLAFEGVAGRFYAQDKGYSFTMQRFFGDTALSLYYKDTKTPLDNQRWRQAGVRVDFPLTPRRDSKAHPVQVRGNQAWSYAQETGVVSSSNQDSNYINPNLAVLPDTAESVAAFLYDRERLNPDYIQAHTDRMKDAWLLYRNRL